MAPLEAPTIRRGSQLSPFRQFVWISRSGSFKCMALMQPASHPPSVNAPAGRCFFPQAAVKPGGIRGSRLIVFAIYFRSVSGRSTAR